MMKRPFNDHVNALAAYMPDGDLFAAKHIADSNFRQLLRGITYELFDAQGYLCDLEEQYFPDATESFLSEWEQALGIPDDCFSGTGDVLERRRDIVVKLAALGIQTAEDFRQLAEVFGEVIAVVPGSEYTNYPLPVPADDQKRYYIIIEFTPATGGFPYTFPFTFGSDAIRILECLFVSLAPANCRVLFRRIQPSEGGGFDDEAQGVMYSDEYWRGNESFGDPGSEPTWDSGTGEWVWQTGFAMNLAPRTEGPKAGWAGESFRPHLVRITLNSGPEEPGQSPQAISCQLTLTATTPGPLTLTAPMNDPAAFTAWDEEITLEGYLFVPFGETGHNATLEASNAVITNLQTFVTAFIPAPGYGTRVTKIQFVDLP